MEKIDYKRVYKEVYGGRCLEPELVAVPPMHYLMLDGAGDPETEPRFGACVETLFSLAYAVKGVIRNGPMALDFTVMPLEGLWWADDMQRFASDRAAWRWTLLIMMPPVVDEAMLDRARTELAQRKSLPLLGQVRWEALEEGRAVQVLHRGPFSKESATVARLHGYMKAHGLTSRGKHHEVYLSDMRRAAPEKWRTVLRQPVA